MRSNRSYWQQLIICLMAKEVRAALKAALFCCVKQTVSLRMVRKLSATSQEITLKAFASSSPGLRFGNPGNIHSFLEDATPTKVGVASRFRNRKTLSQLLQSCEESLAPLLNPGFQSKHFHPVRAARPGTPAWAGISERFQRCSQTN